MTEPLKENASAAGTDQGAQKTTLQADIKLCSGFGQFHSNEPTAKNRKPYTPVTMSEIEAMVKDPQAVDKTQARWMIPSALLSRNFAEQEKNGEYWALWADFDQEPKPIADISWYWEQCTDGCNAMFYSSRSATAERQKSRLIVPLANPLTAGDWLLAAECLNDTLEAAGFAPDRVSERAAQLCYLPNRGAFYDAYTVTDGKHFDPLTFFADQIAAKKAAIVLAEQDAEKRIKAAEANRLAFRASGSTSAVDAFNACHSVDEVLLKAGYNRKGSHYRHPQSESGGYSASVKDGRVFSLSSSDPLYTGGAGNGAHDAFSAWAVLLFGGDMTAAAKHVHDMARRAA